MKMSFIGGPLDGGSTESDLPDNHYAVYKSNNNKLAMYQRKNAQLIFIKEKTKEDVVKEYLK